MFTDQYNKSLISANNIARASLSNKIDSYHFLAGILHVEECEMSQFLNGYGLNSEWFYDTAPTHIKKYDPYDPYCFYINILPFNEMMKRAIENAKKAAEKNNTKVDLSHILYNLLSPNVSFFNNLIRKKLVYSRFEHLKDKLFQMMSNKPPIVNQVIIE